MRSALLGAILAATAPAAVNAQTPHPASVTAPQGQVQAKAAIAECDRLIAYLEQSQGAAQEVTLEQVRAWREPLNPEPCHRHLERLTRIQQTQVTPNASERRSPAITLPAPAESERAASQTEVVQQQAAPRPALDQPTTGVATPQVLVQQNQPNITVRQRRPEIIIRQAPPIITVPQPQPEIIVRMPEPDVNIVVVQPQVEVWMAQPQIHVMPPQMQIRPIIQVDCQQPDVRFERTGEPEIIYQPAEGEPKIRFETASAANAEQTTGPASPSPARDESMAARPGAASPAPLNGLSLQGAQASLNMASKAAAGTMPTNEPPQTGAVPGIVQQSLKVSDLEARKLYDAGGAEIVLITKIVSGPEDRQFLVVSYGSFLNLGGKDITIPIDRVVLRDDRLIALDATDSWLKDTPEFEGGRAYRELNEDDTAIVRVPR